MSFFKVHHRSKKSKARVGEIYTAHGVVQTPAFVPVATKATVKAFDPRDIKDVGIQIAFVNTYHLVTHPGVEVLEKAGGVHKFSKLNIPLMSDSGGFQVFSLANNKKSIRPRGDGVMEKFKQIGTLATPPTEDALVVKITSDGVTFRSVYDGSLIEFTPETSMKYQQGIGADLVMAFDECTYYPATHEYATKAMHRTHAWLKRCIGYMQKNKSDINSQQYLYGIIQGGTFEDLRKESAKFISEQDVPGVAIGGVSVGETKKEMRQQVKWVSPYLLQDKPVHLLGIGQLDDMIDLIGEGIDSFDCVEPTRVARMGKIYQIPSDKKILSSWGAIDIFKGIYKENLDPLDIHCECYVCQNFTKAYMHHLLKQKELLGYTLATYHNLYVMERFMAALREAIVEDRI